MAPTNSLAGVEIFLRVVKAGSFTAAASQLGLSKSGIAKSVSQLEARLGVRLLHRTTRRLSLTPEGALFFERSDAAVEQLREAEDLARSRATTLRGVLRVDMPASYGRRVALPVLLDILKAHPELRLDASFSDRVIDPVEEGVDLCIRFGSLPDRADLAARKLGEQRLIICAAPEYLRETSIPESVAELDAHASVVGSRGGRPNRWLLTDGNGSTFTYEPSATHLCSDGDAVIAMTLAGFGLCQMPESLLLPHIRDGSLTRVLDQATYAQSTCHAVWPIVRQMLPRVRVVVDELVRRGRAGEL
jgi:DNA-binding transcriptional LysR family regulator